MSIWENILDSLSRTIFNKAFKPSVSPDLCGNALNLSYITWSGLQPCLPLETLGWMFCALLSQQHITAAVANQLLGLERDGALAAWELLCACWDCCWHVAHGPAQQVPHERDCKKPNRFISCSMCHRKSTQQVSPWSHGKCSLVSVREDLALVSGCCDTSLFPSPLCVVPAKS